MKRNIYRYVAMLLFIAAAVLIAAGVGLGQLHIGFILIIPVIYGSGPVAILAALFVFASFLLFAFSGMHGMEGEAPTYTQREFESTREETHSGRKGKFGGVIFIGPIPIIFGSDRKIGGYMVAAAIVILILILLSFLLGIL